MFDPLEQMIAKMASGGWADLENIGVDVAAMNKTASQAEKRARDREAAIVAKALGTKDGKALLELLMKKTILRTPEEVERAAQTAEAYAILKAKREGQNQVVFTLLSMLQHHRHGRKSKTGDEL